MIADMKQSTLTEYAQVMLKYLVYTVLSCFYKKQYKKLVVNIKSLLARIWPVPIVCLHECSLKLMNIGETVIFMGFYAEKVN